MTLALSRFGRMAVVAAALVLAGCVSNGLLDDLERVQEQRDTSSNAASLKREIVNLRGRLGSREQSANLLSDRRCSCGLRLYL